MPDLRLPPAGWTAHLDQSSAAALDAGAFQIRTVLVSGVVVITKQWWRHDGFATLSFESAKVERDGGHGAMQLSTGADRARAQHYETVNNLIASGKVTALV